MFCEKCGTKVGDNDAFCAKCGAKISPVQGTVTPSPATTTPMPVQAPNQYYAPAPVAYAAQPAAQVAQPAKKKTPIIIALIIAAAIIIAACIFAFTNTGIKGNTLPYTTSQRIVVSNAAPITVCNNQSKPLTHFTLFITRADGSTNIYDINGSTFTFGDIGEPTGDVTAFVRDEKSDFVADLPIDSIVSEEEASSLAEDSTSNTSNDSADEGTKVITDGTTIVPSGDKPSDTNQNDVKAQAASMALYEKYLELKMTYGEATCIYTGNSSLAAFDGVGILLADVDKDGVTEMVSIALDAAADPTKGHENLEKYHMTLWRYNQSTHSVESIYETDGSCANNGGLIFFPIHTDENGYVSIGISKYLNGVRYKQEFFGYDASTKKFGVIRTATVEGEDIVGPSVSTYTIDGKQVSMDEYNTNQEAWFKNVASYYVVDVVKYPSTITTTKMVETMKAAEKQLREGALITTRTPASSGNSGATAFFSSIPSSFTMASGVGAWASSLTINPDGTYTISFHDVNMGETGAGYKGGTIYVGECEGTFGNVQKVDDYTYTVEILSETRKGTPNESRIVDNVKYITADTGLGKAGTTCTFYLPGHPISSVPESVLLWDWSNKERKNTTLSRCAIGVGTDGAAYFAD